MEGPLLEVLHTVAMTLIDRVMIAERITITQSEQEHSSLFRVLDYHRDASNRASNQLLVTERDREIERNVRWNHINTSP